jgi:hypothetical protein
MVDRVVVEQVANSVQASSTFDSLRVQISEKKIPPNSMKLISNNSHSLHITEGSNLT